MTEWMTSKLALNTKQVEQVSALNLQYAQKNDPIFKVMKVNSLNSKN
jgi:hypothetical protein